MSIFYFGKVFGVRTETSKMRKTGLITIVFLILIAITSCSRKIHPSVPTAATNTEPVVTPKAKPVSRTIPKVIAVNDKVAKRSVDGRYYYDLQGHRYWRNNRDGKYYLFHKSMFDNADFKNKSN